MTTYTHNAQTLAELATLAAADDFDGMRMTGAQYAELTQAATRAELAAARRSGLYLTRDRYADLEPELCSAVALAGLERARMIDSQTGHDAPRDGYAPRWVAVYAEHRAPEASGAEWSELHRAERAQLVRSRWVAWLRNVARRELDSLRAQSAAEDGSADVETVSPEERRAARHANAENLTAALAARLERAGRPLGALERHAIAGALSRLSHAERAELIGTTPEACKTYAAKGRANLRKRWITLADARAELASADCAADRDDLYAAAMLLAPCGPLASAEAVAETRRAMIRAERAERAETHRADTAANVEAVRSGHAGGVVRMVEVAPETATQAAQYATAEAMGKSNVGHAVHRAGIGSRSLRYARLTTAAYVAASYATAHALAGRDDRAAAERENVRAILAAAPTH